MNTEQKPVYRYVGPGIFYGIPARDLTAADIANLEPLQLRTVRDAAEYVEVEPPKPDPPANDPPPTTVTPPAVRKIKPEEGK